MTIVLTWYQLRKLAGSLRSAADSAAKGVMEPTTAADNRPSPALLLIRAHRALLRIRSSVLTHILTLLMLNLLSSLRLDSLAGPESHFAAENAAGVSNWLLMF